MCFDAIKWEHHPECKNHRGQTNSPISKRGKKFPYTFDQKCVHKKLGTTNSRWKPSDTGDGKTVGFATAGKQVWMGES